MMRERDTRVAAGAGGVYAARRPGAAGRARGELLHSDPVDPIHSACGQVPVAFALPGGPLLLGGPVVSGFGRGSRQMGVPTANIDPVPLQAKLADMPLGVYFGCATCAAGWQLQLPRCCRVGTACTDAMLCLRHECDPEVM